MSCSWKTPGGCLFHGYRKKKKMKGVLLGIERKGKQNGGRTAHVLVAPCCPAELQ